MGNSGEDSTKGIDVSVGGLVWVRRRNGSWWPGRVLGPDELPEGCMPTPRSGTPVKLLGREDASVDWYNLEKSKRVKAFRCGEYDACIEKAKASASNSSKKAVKYARREDAILHALEIESAHLGKDGPVLSTEQNVKNEEHLHVGESPSSSHHDKETEDINEDLGMPEDDSDSGPDISHSGVSFEEPKRRRTPNDSDDGNEGAKRMRGLEDLGMGVSSSSRRKRSQIPHVHEFLKRKNRKRPLAKVLEYTAMVPVPLFCDLLSSPTGSSIPESKISGLQSCESKINDSVMVNNNSDSNGVSCENEISSVVGITSNGSAGMLFDVPLVAEEKQSTGLSAIDAATQSDHIKPISLGNDEHNETGSTSSDTVDIHNITQRNDKGTAEWQLKGKRNSRSRKRDIEDEAAETYTQGIERDSNRSGGLLISRPVPDTQPEYFRGWSWNAPNKETVAPQRRLPYRQSRFVLNPKYDSSDFSLGHHTASSGLYDVDVEVKASYRPQGVPYISLMSKLHGQPIIGHPLSIEVLDNGFSDNILSFSECYSSSSEFDYNLSGVSVFRGDYEMKPRGHPPNKHRSKARRNGGLSKKIRKLSSLTGAHRRGEEQMKPVMEKLKGPSIACVPLNVVFSRINASLNSSIRPPPRLNTIDDV